MATLSAILEALAGQLGAIPGLNVYVRYPDQIVAPALVFRLRRARLTTLDGPNWPTVELVLFCQSVQNGLAPALEALEPYLDDSGSYSVLGTLEADPTLGGLVDDLLISAFSEVDTYKYAEIEYSGCRWEVEVMRS